MKHRLSLLLAAAALLSALILPAAAYTPQELNTADALYALDLFLGTGTTYDLDAGLTRAQGVVLLVRMLGEEKAAASAAVDCPFTDLAEWAAPYAAYAWRSGLTNGISATEFGGDLPMSRQMFLTLVLRALGYRDSGENADFTYDDAVSYAAALGLPTGSDAADFRRADVVRVFWAALSQPLAEGAGTLADALIQKGTFSAEDLVTAQSIVTFGRGPGDGTGEKSTFVTYTWEEFSALTIEQARAYYASFDTPEAYDAWYASAYAAYLASANVIEITVPDSPVLIG